MSRWNEKELQLIKDVFQDEGFLLAVRDVMMGFEDKFTHQTTDDIIGILQKVLLPSYQPNVPLEMQQDLCHLSLNFITGFNAEQGVLRIKAYDIAKDYIERRFNVVLGGEDTGDTLNDLRDKADNDDDRFVRMLAYLQLGGYIESSLSQLSKIAKHKELTSEELKERQEKNSNK